MLKIKADYIDVLLFIISEMLFFVHQPAQIPASLFVLYFALYSTLLYDIFICMSILMNRAVSCFFGKT